MVCIIVQTIFLFFYSYDGCMNQSVYQNRLMNAPAEGGTLMDVRYPSKSP